MAQPSALLVLMWTLGVCATARADDLAAASGSVTADPNAARFGLMFRGAMRAQLGASLALSGSEAHPGLALWLSPLVELHEPASSDQILPSQYWRARVGIAASYGWHMELQRYRVLLALEHESDHETAHEYSTAGFLTQNALALGGDGQWELGALRLRVMPVVRVYLLSCTRDRERCRELAGDGSVGAQLDVTIDAPSWSVASLVPFVSASALGIVANDRVRGEHHVELHLGLWAATSALLFQAFALTYLGNDVGITRGQRVTQLGLGLSLSPRLR